MSLAISEDHLDLDRAVVRLLESCDARSGARAAHEGQAAGEDITIAGARVSGRVVSILGGEWADWIVAVAGDDVVVVSAHHVGGLQVAKGALDPTLGLAALELVDAEATVLTGQGHTAAIERTEGRAPYEFLFARSIAGGTSEISRNVIAERLLGLPREPSPA